MKVITFFSYKGGAGRSTLALNTIPILAAEHYKPTPEKPIIIVDMDVDSCGMSYLLAPNVAISNETNVQNLLYHGCNTMKVDEIKYHPFMKGLIPVGHAYGYPQNDAVLLLPAKDGLAIDSERGSNYNGSNEEAAFNTFIDVCEDFDVPLLVIDSAVGNNLTANISNRVSDVILCCMRPTTQFVNGTKRYLESLEGPKDIGLRKNIIVVPNVVPQDRITLDNAIYPDYAVSNIKNSFNSLFGGTGRRHRYCLDFLSENAFGIPAVKSFMWREDLLYIKDADSLLPDEKLAIQRYKALAAKIYEI